MRKQNITFLKVMAEQVRKAELQICASQGRSEVWKQNFTYLAVKAERKCGSGTSYFWQSMQNESAEEELKIFGSKDRAEAEFRSLAVKAERTCGSGTSGIWQHKQSRSVEAIFQIFSSQDSGGAETALQIFDSPVKLDVRKQILTSLTGPYPTDCHCQC